MARASAASRASALGLSLALLAGCGGARPATPALRTESGPLVAATVPGTTAPAVTDAPVGPRKAHLSYELDGRRFPLPLVRGTIGGQSVWMLVDTGANSHVVASWVARRVGLPMRALGNVGSDHTGKAVRAYSVEHPGIVLDEWGALPDGEVLVTDVPEAIERIGIGAFVSPQWLAGQGEGLVLDLAGAEMHAAPWDEASRTLEGRPGSDLAPAGVHACRDDASAIRGLAFVLRASVDGHGVDLLLDTGAHRTDLLTTSAAGKALAPRAAPSHEPKYAASGLVQTLVVRGVALHVGDWAVTSDVDLVAGVADPLCPRDGVVSMDALASCMLLFGQGTMRGRCGP